MVTNQTDLLLFPLYQRGFFIGVVITETAVLSAESLQFYIKTFSLPEESAVPLTAK